MIIEVSQSKVYCFTKNFVKPYEVKTCCLWPACVIVVSNNVLYIVLSIEYCSKENDLGFPFNKEDN